MIKVLFLLILFLVGCDDKDTNTSSNHNHNQVIVSLQDSDAVSFVGSDNLEIMDQFNINLNTINCSEIENQMECEMSGCMWHEMDNGMNHCMMHA